MLTSGPRIFVSYARSDGKAFARELSERLRAAGFSLWRDLANMEGGRDWWQQIEEAIRAVEYLILVITEGALRSNVVRKEWRFARQEGRCVIPVLADKELTESEAFRALPGWMRRVDFVDADDPERWTRLVRTLEKPCKVQRVPFMAGDLPEDFVARPEEMKALTTAILDEARGEAVAITTALEGAGGYGKTALAKALCHEDTVQEVFYDGVLWVTLGEAPGDLMKPVADLIEILTGTRPGLETMDAAKTKLAETLQDRTALIVIDDLWNGAHLEPFLQGGPRCARLITTRIRATIPAKAQRVGVDAMRDTEALALLGYALPDEEQEARSKLAERLGEWPLLLKLANGVLRERVNGAGQPLGQALDYVERALSKRGLQAFDAAQTDDRNQAVAATLGASLDLLGEDERTRFAELAAFPEDVEIPLSTVEALWNGTGGLDDLDTEDLYNKLFRFNLLWSLDLAKRQLRLHDVIRAYLLPKTEEARRALHGALIDAYRARCPNGWASGPDDGYFFQYLPYHFAEAGRRDELRGLLLDYDWLLAKLRATDAQALIDDCDLLAENLEIRLLQVAIRHSTPALMRDPGQLPTHLVGRFLSFEEAGLHGLCERARAQGPGRPWLCPKTSSLRPPGGFLTQTLVGHTNAVLGAAVLADGRRALSWSWDGTLRLWDLEAGAALHTLEGHTEGVSGAAVLADGRRALSWSRDNTLRLWDLEAGAALHTLEGHTYAVSGAAVLADGRRALSWSRDNTLRLWDLEAGAALHTLEGHTDAVRGAAVLADGRRALLWSDDRTLRLWDLEAGAALHTLEGHTDAVSGAAVLADGRRALSWSWDGTLRLWDLEAGAALHTLEGHTEGVSGAAVLADGRRALSWSDDRTLRLWDLEAGAALHTLEGHKGPVYGAAVLADGRRALSWSWDGTLRLWDLEAGAALHTLEGHTDAVSGAAMLADGRRALSWSEDWSLILWDLETGHMIARFIGDASIGGVIEAREDLFVAGSNNGAVQILELRQG